MPEHAEPPAYTPPSQPPPISRTIQDLRAQIIANGSIIKPRSDNERPNYDHIEVVVSKAPAASPSRPAALSTTHWSDKQAAAFMNEKLSKRTSNSSVPLEFGMPASSSAPASGGQHYAMLIRRTRTGSRDINVLMQGEPKDTVEEALEWMLERTEMVMHDLLVKHAKPNEDGCCVM